MDNLQGVGSIPDGVDKLKGSSKLCFVLNLLETRL